MTSGNVDSGFSTTDAYGNGVGDFFRKVWAGGDWSSSSTGVRGPNAYSAVPFKVAHFPIITYREFGGPIQQRSATAIGDKPTFPRPNLYNEAVNKLFGEIKGSDFNAAVTAAQFGETFKMLGDSAYRLAKAWNQAKRGDFIGASIALTGRAKGPRNKVANNWLELQYGWLPLLSDCYDASKFVESKLQNIEKSSFTVKISQKSPGEYSHYWVNYAKAETLAAITIQAVLEEKVSLAAQLGLTDPLSIAWELMPYSFVIDWFLPIGPYLEAVSAARSMKGTFWVTRYNKDVAAGMQSGSPLPSGNRIFEVLAGGDAFRLVDITLFRSQDSSLNPELPSFKPLEKALSLRHSLNGLALLSNLKR
jgi:hypothetical protein